MIEAIEELDLEDFYASYRADGHGRAAHDPKMMLTLLTYAYAVGERSSRGIERRCREDVAFRVICANQVPDHATIARFRVRHEQALSDIFSQVLGLCAEAELVRTGVLAVDGSKFAAAASDSAIRTYEKIAEEILAEAGRIDRAEDEIYGEARGDELPEYLARREGRRAWPATLCAASHPSRSRFRMMRRARLRRRYVVPSRESARRLKRPTSCLASWESQNSPRRRFSKTWAYRLRRSEIRWGAEGIRSLAARLPKRS